MALARQIIEMLRSHTEQNEERFRAAALQIAANEARQGHDDVAREIQRLVEASQKGLRTESEIQRLNSVPITRPQGELAGLLHMVQPAFGLSKLVLPSHLRDRLERVVKEQKQFVRLREHGLRPRQKLLLLGPPGCGKTMTAHALAHDLGLPLFVVRLDALFTKFLGETAAKLRLIFDAVDQHRAVFLFDEFDSLGLARGAQHDVAEMRRVLNSFLVFIENMQGHSLVIAASNHPEALDVALFRRFDDIIEYSMPSQENLATVFRQRLATEKCVHVDWTEIAKKAVGMSFADAARVADEAVKERIIERHKRMTSELLLKAIGERAKQRASKKRK